MAVSIALIACKPVGLLVRAARMVGFEQPRETTGTRLVVRYDLYVHEIAYATIALAIVMLLIVCIPFRKREKWAWWAVSVVAATYIVPEFLLPYFVNPLRPPYVLWSWIHDSGPAAGFAFVSVLLSILTLLGLVTAIPEFFRGDKTLGRRGRSS
jgi:hypothetical protein